MYFEILGQMKKMLGQLDKWLDAAAALAETRKFDSANFLSLRLAPDQFPFVRQVQSSCDTAKLIAARLGGKTAPSHADDETTLAQLQARVRSVVAYLGEYSAQDFTQAAGRVITTARWEGKVMSGADYFLEHGMPNFFFHITHAYAILRHAGVTLGKRDYLGALSQRLP